AESVCCPVDRFDAPRRPAPTGQHVVRPPRTAIARRDSPPMANKKNIVDGFPALKKLGFDIGLRSVPFVQQLEWTDCGAASLCMVMAYYGREAKLAEVRDAMGIGRDGVSAKGILD